MPRALAPTRTAPTWLRNAAPSRSIEGIDLPLLLVTPMLGGGWKAGDVDCVTPVAGKAVRGHLRSWWRIVKGVALGDRMAEYEEAIFGSASSASPLIVTVSIDSPIERRPWGAQNAPSRGQRMPQEPYGLPPECSYVLFPALERKRPGDPPQADPVEALLREGLRFTVRLRWPDTPALANRRTAENKDRVERGLAPVPELTSADINEHLASAAWVWATFGGIGARTRRGLGALRLRASVPAPPHGVPGLRVLAGPPCGGQPADAINAWARAISAYRRFRQDRAPEAEKQQLLRRRGNLEVQKKKLPGKSRWPEPDSIRRLTGQSLHPASRLVSGATIDLHDHRPDPHEPNLFPRAALGLPIVFHFSDGPTGALGALRPSIPAHQLDPGGNPTLVPVSNETGESLDRMASPVLVRPLRVGDSWRPAFVFLPERPPAGLRARLKADSRDHEVEPTQIRGLVTAAAPLRGRTDALEALADFLAEHGYRFIDPGREA